MECGRGEWTCAHAHSPPKGLASGIRQALRSRLIFQWRRQEADGEASDGPCVVGAGTRAAPLGVGACYHGWVSKPVSLFTHLLVSSIALWCFYSHTDGNETPKGPQGKQADARTGKGDRQPSLTLALPAGLPGAWRRPCENLGTATQSSTCTPRATTDGARWGWRSGGVRRERGHRGWASGAAGARAGCMRQIQLEVPTRASWASERGARRAPLQPRPHQRLVP